MKACRPHEDSTATILHSAVAADLGRTVVVLYSAELYSERIDLDQGGM